MLEFDWDEANLRHIARHSVSPEEAEQVILNELLELSYQIVDDEIRMAEVGETNGGRILTVVTTWRDQRVRVVTAYDAVKAARTEYIVAKGRLQ